jgi:phytoene dehydrogenase-like protein
MSERYPGYDVLRKRNGPSWNDITRRVIDTRLNVPRQPRFFNEAEWRTLEAVCDQIMPQPAHREKVPLPAYVDQKLQEGATDGYRYPGMPHQGEAWRRGLAALDEAAQRDSGKPFHALRPEQQEAMLRSMQEGKFQAGAMVDMPAKTFFEDRIVHDIVDAYYAHPLAWNEIGWGGPASPRGYVRLELGRRDPWEPEEAMPGHEAEARRRNRRVG